MLLIKSLPKVWFNYIRETGELNGSWKYLEVTSFSQSGSNIRVDSTDMEYLQSLKCYISKDNSNLRLLSIPGCDQKLPYSRYIATIEDNNLFLNPKQIATISETRVLLDQIGELNPIVEKLKAGEDLPHMFDAQGPASVKLAGKWYKTLGELHSLSAQVIVELSKPYLK